MLILLMINLALANPAPQQWRAGPVNITLVEAPGGGLINPACLPPKECASTLAIKSKASLPKDWEPVLGGSICTETHKGQILYASHGRKNQPICLFPDGSYASLDALIKEN